MCHCRFRRPPRPRLLGNHAGSNFPVAAITYGPTVDDEAAGHALRALVKHHGFDPRKLTVKPSVIPFST